MCPDGVTNGLADTSGLFVLLTELLEELLDIELDEGKGDPETVLLSMEVGE